MAQESESKALVPRFKWAQDFDILLISIELTDVDPNKMTVKIERESLYFKGESNGKLYELSFKFRFPVNPKTAKFSVKRLVEFIIDKETSEAFWPHLLSKEDKTRLKGSCFIDWDRFKDEDDLEEDGGGLGDNMDMSQFQGMGGMPGMGGMGGGMPGMGGMGGMGGMMGGMPGMGGMGGGMPGMPGGGMGGMDMEALQKLAAFGGGDGDDDDDDDDDEDSDDGAIPDLENENNDASDNKDTESNNVDDTTTANTDENKTETTTTDATKTESSDTTKAADATTATNETATTGDAMVDVD